MKKHKEKRSKIPAYVEHYYFTDNMGAKLACEKCGADLGVVYHGYRTAVKDKVYLTGNPRTSEIINRIISGHYLEFHS